MSGVMSLWNQVWPNLAATAVVVSWHHWKIRAALKDHILHITATLNNQLTIEAGVGVHREDHRTP